MTSKFELDGTRVYVRDLISAQNLERSHFGFDVPGHKLELELLPEEALYLMEVRNAHCTDATTKAKLRFNQASKPFAHTRKFLARYFCYKEWRDRGLVPRPYSDATSSSGVKHKPANYGQSPLIKYPEGKLTLPSVKANGQYFSDDLMCVVDDNQTGLKLYEDGWWGQYGTYKAKKHGQYLKLDAYETLFLNQRGKLKLDITAAKLIAEAKKRRADFESLYAVFEDWRERGYVLKTGFKFGTHFRLYLPGANPTGSMTVNATGPAVADADEWVHSKHVVHVFPRDSKLLISEWARAIRVAHGVKKTFILAIPGKRRGVAKAQLDFLLYGRKADKTGIETPKEKDKNGQLFKPRYAMLALSEEEEIGGEELAESIAAAAHHGLDLMLGICDRETAVTFYRVKRVELPHSKFEYYEIEWVQP